MLCEELCKKVPCESYHLEWNAGSQSTVSSCEGQRKSGAWNITVIM